MVKKDFKKIKILCFSLKKVISYLLLLVCLCCLFFASSKTEFVSTPKDNVTIVIDAGHGFPDGGSVGKFTKVVESKLNLEYAKNLKGQLIGYGFDVVMTRTNDDGLHDKSATNLKKSDMKRRKEIINTSSADLVISIHMNSFPLESSKGAQVFFKKDDDISECFAKSIQEQVRSILRNTTKAAMAGDYYILNCTTLPTVLIECGFLSNREEETLLQQKEYQKKFCYAVLCGVVDFYRRNEL